MGEIPTAEEFLNMLDERQGTMWTEDNEEICKAFIEFAKLHVEAALKEASETKIPGYHGDGVYNRGEADKDSILNSYPLENIK